MEFGRRKVVLVVSVTTWVVVVVVVVVVVEGGIHAPPMGVVRVGGSVTRGNARKSSRRIRSTASAHTTSPLLLIANPPTPCSSPALASPALASPASSSSSSDEDAGVLGGVVGVVVVRAGSSPTKKQPDGMRNGSCRFSCSIPMVKPTSRSRNATRAECTLRRSAKRGG